MTKKLFLIASFFIASSRLHAQELAMPASIKEFILKGYEKLDYIEGDLNGDKKDDAILILKIIGEDTATDDNFELRRPFLLLIRQPDGKLKVEKRNDELVMCAHCGGVFGDPYDNTKIEKGGFVISFYGGSNWRWGYEYTFKYNAAKKNWFLIKEHQMNYNTIDPNKTVEADIEEAELGIVPIEKFDIDPPYKETKWRVTAEKSYFYNSPNTGSKPRKGYLIKGYQVTAIRELTHFVEITFQDKKEKFTSGYILKSTLQKQ